MQVTSVASDCSLEAAKAAERSTGSLVQRALPWMAASGFSGPLSGSHDVDTGSRDAWIGLIGSERCAAFLSKDFLSFKAAKAAELTAGSLVRRALPRIVASGFAGPLSGSHDVDKWSRDAWIGLIGSERCATFVSKDFLEL